VQPFKSTVSSSATCRCDGFNLTGLWGDFILAA
jgi:hypothetical protein